MKRRINAFMALTMLSLSVSAPVFAVTPGAEPRPWKPGGFCANLSTLQAMSEKQISTQVTSRSEAYDANAKKRAENRQTWDEKRLEAQKKWDGTREKNLTTLDAKAKTPVQQAAVLAYRKALLSAVEARRLSYDKARSDFRAGVDKVLADRNAQVLAAFAQYQTDVKTAFAKADTACKSAKPDESAIRTTLLADLKAARQKLADARKAGPSVGEQISALSVKRQAAEKAADQAFQKARDAARETLQKALADAKITLSQQKGGSSVKSEVVTKTQVDRKPRAQTPSTTTSAPAPTPIR